MTEQPTNVSAADRAAAEEIHELYGDQDISWEHLQERAQVVIAKHMASERAETDKWKKIAVSETEEHQVLLDLLEKERAEAERREKAWQAWRSKIERVASADVNVWNALQELLRAGPHAEARKALGKE